LAAICRNSKDAYEKNDRLQLQYCRCIPPFLHPPPLSGPLKGSLTLEIFQEKKETTFFMDYPRDRVLAGGSIFWWDTNGKWHEL
jgi:hypothetical protein